MMYYNGGSLGFGFGLMHLTLTALWWAFIVFLIISLVRWLRAKEKSGNWNIGHQTPLEILKERYAKGEMSTTEYEERKKTLES